MEGSTIAAWGWLEVQKQPGACWVVGATVDVPSWDMLRLEAAQKLWTGEVRSQLGVEPGCRHCSRVCMEGPCGDRPVIWPAGAALEQTRAWTLEKLESCDWELNACWARMLDLAKGC